MQIHQINCQYLPEEDRLLLRINTTDNLEHQYILSRRYLKLIIKAMSDYFKGCEQTKQPVATPDAQKAIGEFEHQQVVQKADMEKPFEDQQKANVAELLYSLQVKTDGISKIVLGLHTKKKQGIELAMTNEMAHSFFHLLEKTVITAEWDMELYFSAASVIPEDKNRTLH